MTIDIIKHNKEVAVNLQQMAAMDSSADRSAMEFLALAKDNYTAGNMKKELEAEVRAQRRSAVLYAAAREAYEGYTMVMPGSGWEYGYEFGEPW